jgi:hypothetical protein
MIDPKGTTDEELPSQYEQGRLMEGVKIYKLLSVMITKAVGQC